MPLLSDVVLELFGGNYALVDDGTLDTVIRCRRCDWVGRYNMDISEDLDEASLVSRLGAAIEMAAEDHHH